MTRSPTEVRQRAALLFQRAYRLGRTARLQLLDQECAGAEDLRAAVEELLFHHDAPQPAIDALGKQRESAVDLRAVPETIGPYRIEGLLGRGGMGIVYRAQQLRPKRVVALKVLQPGLVRDEMLKRFEQEAELLGVLQHAGIAHVYDAGSCDLGYGEMPYFAMELIDGVPLTQFADDHQLEVRARCELFVKVCEAVQHAHERDIVHRDLKPANILVPKLESGQLESGQLEAQPKILDFGIARSANTDLQLSTMQTGSGVLLGTLPYMSPEQLAGGGDGIDARSDVYSLGVVLYELLAGRLPLDFQGRPLTEIGRMVHDEDPTLLGRFDRAYRGDLETICDKALAKERERRYTSAVEIADDLRRWMDNKPIRARRQTSWYQLRRFAKRNRSLVLGTAGTLLALVIGLIAVWIYADENRDLAQAQGKLREDAESARDSLRWSLYAAQMSQVADEIGNPSGFATIRRSVTRWTPKAGQEDLRGWEWYVLKAYSSGEVQQHRFARGGKIRSLAWIDDGRMLHAAHLGQGGKQYRRWRTSDWTEIKDAPKFFEILAVDRDRGRFALVGRNCIELRRAMNGELVRQFAGIRWPTQAGFSPDGKRLAVIGGEILAGDGRSLFVLDTETGEILARPREDCSYGAATGFSPDGCYLAAAGHPQPKLYLFETKTWQLARTIEWDAARRSAHQIAWHPRDNQIALKYRDGTQITIYDAESGRVLREVEGRRMGGQGLDWSRDGHRIVAGGDDESVGFWDLRTNLYKMLGSHDAIAPKVVIHPGGRLVASGGVDGTVRIWDVERPRAIRSIVEPGVPIPRGGRIAFRTDGLLAVREGARTRLLDPVSGEERESFDSSRAVWNRDGSLVAFRRGEEVQVRRRGETRVLASHKFGSAAHAYLAWHPNDDRLFVPTREESYLWEPLKRDAEPRKFGFRRVFKAWWSASGEVLAQVLWSNDVAILDAETGEVLRRIPVGRGHGHAPAPSGTRFVTGTQDHYLRIYDHATGEELAAWDAHGGRVLCVAWSPDGSRIASGGRDNLVRIWDTATQKQVMVLRHDETVTSLAWSPDGSMLASATADGRVRIADARSR